MGCPFRPQQTSDGVKTIYPLPGETLRVSACSELFLGRLDPVKPKGKPNL